jgi:predicted dehydrogenase
MARRPIHGLAVIGCGNMGRSHAAGAVESGRARLLATVDRRPEAARVLAERYGAALHSDDPRAILGRDDIDVVVIATNPSSHRDLAMACMEAGKHVLLEKPLAPTMAQAEAIVRAALRHDRKLRVGYILRHNRSYQRLVALAHSGVLGSPLLMRMLGGEHIVTEEHWQQDLALLTDTSPIIDCGCHYVDAMRWLTGAEAVRVSGTGCRLDPRIPGGCYDYGAITIAFSDGSTGLYEVGWTRAYRSFSEKEVIGPTGRLRLVYAGERLDSPERGDLIELHRPPNRCRRLNVPGEFKPVGRQLADLFDCIEQDLDPMPPLTDAMRSLQIALAGNRAIRTGATIRITPWEPPRVRLV